MPALVNRRNHLLCIAEAIYRLNISRWSTILSHTEYAALKCHRCEARDRPPPPIFCMQIWYPSHHRTSPAAVFIKSAATYCNNNSHYVSDIHADNTASVWRGLFITDYIPPLLPPLSSLLLSPASLTGFFFQPPPFIHLLHLLRLRSPSLCGTPRALSGLKYDMIPATATIAQQCGRIVAASGATTTPSERRRRLSVSVSSSLPSPRHGLCRLRAHAVSLCLPPPLRFFLPIIKSVSSPSLLCSPPPPPPPPAAASPPPPPPVCSNPQLNTVCVMLYCASSARRSSTYIPSVCVERR